MPERIYTIALYAQDKHGLGHINRTLAIARRLLAAQPRAVAVILTKSGIPSIFSVPERCDFIKLPVRITPAEVTQTAAEQEAARARHRALTRQLLRDAVVGLAPELVLVDHEPLGYGGEFRDGLYALKERSPATRFVFGLRDIMDDPARIRLQWQVLGAYEAMEHLFDGIAVYGAEQVYNVAEAYALPEAVRAKLHYCGYIVRDPPAPNPHIIRAEYGLPERAPLIVAAVGGGSDGYPALAAAVAALEQVRARQRDLCAIVVTGPLMPAEQRRTLLALATGWRRVVEQADIFALMAAADAAITMGGYNTVSEALAMACPAVIVPRATHKVEQLLRAQTLEELDLARCVPPHTLTAERVADALDWALQLDRSDYAARVRRHIPSFDGAAALAAYLAPWLVGR